MIRRFFMAFKVVPSRKDIEQFIERFIERKLKETRIEERITELRRMLGLERKTKAPPTVKVAAPERTAAPPPPPASPPVAEKPAAAQTERYEAVPPPKVTQPDVPTRVEVGEARQKTEKKPAKKPAARKAKIVAKAPVQDDGAEPLEQVLAALDSHPKKAALLKAGKQKDQLLRSLIPLFVARDLDVEVSSGVASKFWAKHGVKFAAPNAAKVLREHEGYAKRTAKGPQISPNGVKYVEDALAAK